MKTKEKKISAAIMATIIVLGSTCGFLIADQTGKTVSYADELPSLSTQQKETETTKAEQTEKIEANDEVVYVFSDQYGNVNKVMDSLWMNDNDSTVQTANEAKLPIKTKITYTLDQKKIEASELAGKSGHLKIRIDFEDLAYEMREVNGSTEKIYVPFIASAVTALDAEKYSNVEVSTGKVAFDGMRYAVVGLALPGLQEDIGLSEEEELDIPKYIEMEADVKDCEIEGMYILVSNSVFNELDAKSTDKIDDLREDVSKINEAMTALMDGSDQLYDGIGKLQNGAVKLSDGVNTLSNGLGTIDSNSDALVGGAAQVFQTLLDTASSELEKSGISVGSLTKDNYADVLNGIINAGGAEGAARAGAAAEVEKNNDTIRATVTSKVKAVLVKQQIMENDTIKTMVANGVAESLNASTGASYTATDILDAVAGGHPQIKPAFEQALSDQADTLISTNNAAIAPIVSGVDAYLEANPAIIDGKVAEAKNQLIEDNMGTALATANAKISSLKSSLDSYNTFYQGIIAYTDGVKKAYDGSKEITKNMPELLNGINALKDGSKELSNGLNTFNEEAIVKLSELVDDTLEGSINRFDVIKEVSRNYNAYDAAGEEKEDGVKFIIKIDSVTE